MAACAADDTLPPFDASCIPDCTGRQCGDNGCGGICGTCSAGLSCQDGQCVTGNCQGGPPTVAGEFKTSLASFTFDAVSVEVTHKQDVDEFEDGCIASMKFTFHRGSGCTLTVTAGLRFDNAGALEIQSVTFLADSQCPGFPDDQEGLYSSQKDMDAAAVEMGVVEVPGYDVTEACFDAGFKIHLAGPLHSSTPDKQLTVQPTVIEVEGAFISAGSTDAACPCKPDGCKDKACGDDGCGRSCGTCPGVHDQCVVGQCVCQPNCAGKQCGDDGCGGECGTCQGVQDKCVKGQCKCQPSCAGKQCGDDGCGGTCGECGENGVCTAALQCCMPTCVDKQCGDDGCGGSCGVCASNAACQGGVCECLTVKCGSMCCAEAQTCFLDQCCSPACAGKQCGSDGCNGICGLCQYGYLCSEGKCVESICPKQCTVKVGGEDKFKQCGPDGCQGYCGFCPEGQNCGEDGFCYAGTCAGNCKNKLCGDDGCGHSCGNCEEGQFCDKAGKCIPHPCGTVTYKGKCTAKYTLVECKDLESVETNCKTMPDKMCGWNQEVGKYDCVTEQECQPQCMLEDGTVKECGDDGCWNFCGTCPIDWGCAAGFCVPSEGAECAWIDNITGSCVGSVRWLCSTGKLYGYDCQEMQGKKCGWDKTANGGKGGYDCL